ncbi:MAG: hypothetical protein GQ535_12615 [Rhodobacteraceae bacterium]|nr:hypothetical protein [Paracoccaceae bacterium]
MPKIVLLENDIWGTLERAVKPKEITGNSLPFSVSLDVDSKAYDAVRKDALLQAKITEAASEKYKAYMQQMASLLKKHDAAYQKAKTQKDADKVLASLESKYKSSTKTFISSAQSAAQSAWEDVKKTKAEYREYQIKAGIGLAIDGLGLAGGVIGTAGAVATGGFALIVALYGVIKTLITITMKLYKLAIDADKMQKRVTNGLKKVQKSYDKKRKELSGAKDTGKAFINSVLGADFIPSLTSVKADNGQYKSKVQGVDVASHKMAQKLNQILAQIDKIEAMPEIKANKKMKAVLSKLRKATANLIDKIIDMQGQVTKGMAFNKSVAFAVKELETLEPKKWKYIQKGLPLIDIVLAGGDFSKAGEALLGIATAAASEADKQLLDAI